MQIAQRRRWRALEGVFAGQLCLRRAGLIAVLACIPLAGCFDMVVGFGGGMSEELRAGGVTAPAQILEIWDTGWTINDSPVIGMKVRVQPPDRPGFEARIEKTTISRLAVPQFQPGNVVPVRFDPNDPAVIAVDFDASAPSTPSSGNPYRARFVAVTSVGVGFLPPPAAPQLYLGTGDNGADTQALYESNYGLLGTAAVQGGSDPRRALEQGKEVGAALVVVYGSFAASADLVLDVLPYRRRPPETGQPSTATATAASAAGLFSGLGAGEQFAAYWGKSRPAILGLVSRPLDSGEQTRIGRKDGVIVEGVANGSPAADARILVGDVIVAIDGKAIVDPLAMPALVSSLAGQSVRIDLIRNGSPLSVTVQLNPASI